MVIVSKYGLKKNKVHVRRDQCWVSCECGASWLQRGASFFKKVGRGIFGGDLTGSEMSLASCKNRLANPVMTFFLLNCFRCWSEHQKIVSALLKFKVYTCGNRVRAKMKHILIIRSFEVSARNHQNKMMALEDFAREFQRGILAL